MVPPSCFLGREFPQAVAGTTTSEDSKGPHIATEADAAAKFRRNIRDSRRKIHD
eukprot:CAMPEP_0113326796 /NCGR_PEP_ID=MMETSP0010_2-20120614/18795_1 /TAXON_ID=216773 ORGANISM="Corethron hystrix, Strain 308" /NCGR_SAMPLE_ID=MMETSP0010_2 /ASSEMBLY_ACC=CAM_ASM_000155 /LENGTH=53 /DNA_ID=CAMNT_0000187317 /DNA_START=177 /DNA_END=338 /DNA_ORIENTATION=- /assembly_acc=CAM_ASM_000155